MYMRGRGVVQDDVQAILLLRKAAEQGHPGAQEALHKVESRLTRVGRYVSSIEGNRMLRAAPASRLLIELLVPLHNDFDGLTGGRTA